MTRPVVSVVIATRDRPLLVREAIDAVLAQDCTDPLEVVVVFDQTEPDTSLARDDEGRVVRVVSNVRKPGLAGARNTGIEAAQGEFVAFCDDDDLWRPTKLRLQLAALRDRPEHLMAATGITVQYDAESFDRSLDTGLITFEALLADRHTELHPSTFLMRRQPLLDDVGLVDEAVPGGFGEDYEFLLRNARAAAIVNVPDPLVVVRWGGQSFFFRRWDTMAEGLSWLLERYPEFSTSRRGSARIEGQVAFAHASAGRRREALRWAGRGVRHRPAEARSYLAVAVVLGLSPAWVMEQLHHRGRGI